MVYVYIDLSPHLDAKTFILQRCLRYRVGVSNRRNLYDIVTRNGHFGFKISSIYTKVIAT